MVLIFTGNEQLDRELSKNIRNNRIVYYSDYVLRENKATVLITAVQPEKFDFKEYMFKVREKDLRVILLLENENVKELNDAIKLGIYDIIFDPFSIEEIIQKVKYPSHFSDISKYMKNVLELGK